MELVRVPAKDLKPHPLNFRIHKEKQTTELKRSLETVGWTDVLLAYREGEQLVLINGHLRASIDPEERVPVIITDLTPEEASQQLLVHDYISEMAEIAKDPAASLMRQVYESDKDMHATIRQMSNHYNIDFSTEVDVEGETDPDAVPEPPDDPVSKLGDIWVCGEHRVMCGDSGSEEDVDKLLDGATIQLVNTDPPYNVKVEPRSNNAIAAGLSSFPAGANQSQKFDHARRPNTAPTDKKLRPKDRPLTGDFISDEDFDKNLRAWFGNIARVLDPGHAFYIWGGYSNWINYTPILEEVGLHFSQGIIWDKQHPVLHRKDYMGGWECAFYGWKKGAAHRWFGPPNVSDLWIVKKISPQKMIHLTEKPVELAVRAINYSSQTNEHVLDLFGGSGSTLIACHQTERKARLMEFDPLYCDVIVNRFEQFTGDKATRA